MSETGKESACKQHECQVCATFRWKEQGPFCFGIAKKSPIEKDVISMCLKRDGKDVTLLMMTPVEATVIAGGLSIAVSRILDSSFEGAKTK